ncbi:MAG: hypothetical protein F2813_02815 [Actinobacteria bacterium]|uniref:Unannotated protein n=1 Tax=freshwater metagenome TaxID=449393 RepID=A0A6J5ZN92_9ZZZZ|nr:hypothetical protein [Actinomycetota bacterium]
MRYVDLLKTTVLLSAASATVLAVLTVIQSNALGESQLVLIAAGWWVVAALIGAWIGRRLEASPSVSRALREAQSTATLPEQNVGRLLLSRVWPLLLAALVSAIFSFFLPQIAAIAAGFMVIWALAWRHQDRAVTAIEERDGVTFFVATGSPVRPIKLVRTPGLRRDVKPEPRGVS